MSGDAAGPADSPEARGGAGRPSWTILTNHGHVLLAVAADPNMLVEEIAHRVGITRRATLHILKDLEEAGYIHRLKDGRRTRYVVEGDRPFRHPAESHHDVGSLLEIFAEKDRGTGRSNDATGR